MNFNFVPLIVVWGILALVVLGLFIWRKNVASNEDDTLHVMSAGVASQQSAIAQKLDMIDKWGKILTVIAVIYGAILGALWVYQSYVTASNISGA